MPSALLHFLFFSSGISGLVYQVVWIRVFGNVFGNTVYSTSLVVAIFMLGLGAGGYLVGAWADSRHQRAPDSLLAAYGYAELAVAALGLLISLVLAGLHAVAAISSWYIVDEIGWFVLSPLSHLARGAIVIALLTPITTLMGGTLTLLIRRQVRAGGESVGRTIALLYGVNTVGAATGAFLTDFVLVPAFGMFATQLVAVGLNVVAGLGALLLARRAVVGRVVLSRPANRAGSTEQDPAYSPQPRNPSSGREGASDRRLVTWTGLALALSGFAALGMEILWLRHFNLLLGGFRAVFSLVLTLVLLGIGAGSLVAGSMDRWRVRPAHALMLVQALFVSAVLLGLRSMTASALAARGNALDSTLPALTAFGRWTSELWFNAWPILLAVGIPSLLMGCSFPLANAVIQHAERVVGRRAGALYLANTAGAVCGSLVAGYLLLPALGMQGSATVLMIAAALALVPLYRASRSGASPASGGAAVPASGLIAAVSIGAWLLLPPGDLLNRSMMPLGAGERLIALSEGVTELVAVTEAPDRGRGLITNGHPMSSTARLDQRYMRALAHIPLLSMEQPSSVLIIGFGVGNSTHAASLHPSVTRIDIADLSRHVLEHAGHFRDANHDVLGHRRVTVYVNDGRHHLQMQPEASYDLITLEPPPIAHAGVAALYSREFYELARSRLTPRGYLSQWLPAYQVPAATSLAMVRAFIDVFPRSVLLSGAHAELLLVGTNDARIEVDPERLARALERAPEVHADLRRLDLGTVTEIAGTFVGSAETLKRATRASPAVSDDHPLQEYGVRSAVGSGLRGVPASLFDLAAVGAWCPGCVDGDRARPAPGLDTYLGLLGQAYSASVREVAALGTAAAGQRRILGSAYLGAIVPETGVVHQMVGVELLRQGRDGEAIVHLQRAVQLDPDNARAQHELGSLLLAQRDFTAAAAHFAAALRVRPDSAAAHNDVGVALASMGELSQAIEHFKQALNLEPGFDESRGNLASALQAQRLAGPRAPSRIGRE